MKLGIDVTDDTFALLSPAANLGPRALWYIPSKDANTITIKIDKARQNNARIGYLVLERAG